MAPGVLYRWHCCSLFLPLPPPLPWLFAAPPSRCLALIVCGFLKDGTEERDVLDGVAVGQDGSIVMAGSSAGAWTTKHDGLGDFVAVKLDANGTELWRWQVGNGVWLFRQQEG